LGFADVVAATVVWTAGMRANALTEQVPGERDALGRLRVDEFLRVIGVLRGVRRGGRGCGRRRRRPRRHAELPARGARGKFVGVNVASDLLGLPGVSFAPDPYVISSTSARRVRC
jgi:NADH:ubiquinone reductase (H+-translocating)